MLAVLLTLIRLNFVANINSKENYLLSINDTLKRNQSEVWQAELRYETFEELPPETVVGDLTNDLKEAKMGYAPVIGYNNFQTNNFIIISQKVPKKHQSKCFTVNSTSGILKIARQIDREDLCAENSADRDSCLVHLDVLNSVESGGWPCFREIIKVTVDILDVNDHKPFFRHIGKVFQASFSELAPVGSGSALPLAEDKDSIKYGVQAYFIEEIFEVSNESSSSQDAGTSERLETNRLRTNSSSGNVFLLDVQELKDSGAILGLVLRIKVPLDRESQDVHWLRLVASDGGSPPLQAQLLIRVVIEDFNDNSPKFEKPIYEFEANQESEGGLAIGRVRARDVDAGANAEVRYFVDSCRIVSPPNWHHGVDSSELKRADVFEVDEVTGEIFGRKREWRTDETAIYKLIVRAEDRGEHTLSDRTTLFIRVIPHWQGSILGKAIANQSHLQSRSKVITPKVAAKLDAGLMEWNRLRFFSRRFSFQVHENQPQSTFVGLFVVANKRTNMFLMEVRNVTNIAYRLKGNKVIHETFLLESQTGMMLTAVELDREFRESYAFGVEALQAKQGRTSVVDSAEVSVQVLDLNDNAPLLTLVERFTGSHGTFSSSETQLFDVDPGSQKISEESRNTFEVVLPRSIPSGSLVFSVHATDLDDGPNGEVNIDILSSGAVFLYDSTRREIELEDQLDCAHRGPVSFVVEACDGGRPKLCSSLDLLLKCPRESDNSTEDWTLARARNVFGGVSKLNLLVVGALTAVVTFSAVLACFFLAGYLKNLTEKSNSTRSDRSVWSVKREGFARPEVDFLRSPQQLWVHDNLQKCLLHTTDV